MTNLAPWASTDLFKVALNCIFLGRFMQERSLKTGLFVYILFIASQVELTIHFQQTQKHKCQGIHIVRAEAGRK